MLLSYLQAAEVLNVSKRQVERLVSAGHIPTIKMGSRSRRINSLDLNNFIEERREWQSTNEEKSGGSSSRRAAKSTVDPLGQPRSGKRKHLNESSEKRLPSSSIISEPAQKHSGHGATL